MIFVQDLDWTAIACVRTLVNEDFFVRQMRQASLAILWQFSMYTHLSGLEEREKLLNRRD